jgi:hypothetical protein
MDIEKLTGPWRAIIARCWEDDEFKKRLMSDPATVLKQNGVDVANGIQIRVLENTDKVLYLTLPAKPREEELSDAELEGVAGGFGPKFAMRSLPKVGPKRRSVC